MIAFIAIVGFIILLLLIIGIRSRGDQTTNNNSQDDYCYWFDQDMNGVYDFLEDDDPLDQD